MGSRSTAAPAAPTARPPATWSGARSGATSWSSTRRCRSRSSRRSSSTGSRARGRLRTSARRCSHRFSTSPCPTANSPPPLDPQTRDELLRSLLLECLRRPRGDDAAAARARGLPLDRPRLRGAARVPRRNVADQPVLILVIARGTVADPPPLASLSQLARFSELRLAELASAGRRAAGRPPAAAALRAPTSSSTPTWSRRITDQGEGNPFYLGGARQLPARQGHRSTRPGRTGVAGAARRAPAPADGPPRPAQRGREGHDQGGERHRTPVPGQLDLRRATRRRAGRRRSRATWSGCTSST